MTQYKATYGNVFLRRGPSTKTQVLKLIPEGDKVNTQEEEKDGWIYCEYDGTNGYCAAKHMEKCAEVEYDDDSIAAAIETAFANLRAAVDELEMIVKSTL